MFFNKVNLYIKNHITLYKYLQYLFFQVFRSHWAWLTNACCERESSHCCGCPPEALLPRLITASPLDAQDWCLHNAFPCVLIEALLTYVGEDLLAFLVQVVRLVEWSFR